MDPHNSLSIRILRIFRALSKIDYFKAVVLLHVNIDENTLQAIRFCKNYFILLVIYSVWQNNKTLAKIKKIRGS